LTLTGATTTCLGTVLALVLALASAQSAPAATVTVNAERGVDTIDVRASAMLKADAATAWRVLTDYDRYVDFIPNLRLSQVVVRRGAMVTVDQSGDAVLWLLKVPVHVTFEIDEIAPDRLQSHAVAGNLRALTSYYALTPAPSGIRMDYVGRVTSGFALFGQIELAVVEKNIARQFQALADQIERQSAGVPSHSVEGAK
jgi:Polyketide cyclase / dehydrase and lipid transport